MVDKKNKEAFESKEAPVEGSPEVKKQAESATAAVESGTLREAFNVLNEDGESAEDGAESMGHVSEKSSEGKERKGGAAAKGSKGDDEDEAKKAEELRKKLINSKPSKKKMLNDIRKHFKAEQKALRKDLKKYARKGDWHRYNGIVARFRQIRDMFSNFAHATYDALKNAWLNIVHNVA
ncbi:hypothetical protein HOG48_02310 [Candidatus Peregrinibacteria bacterium]|nr:hypothetical protein [Candidatus Peregrinibacteria bacterium]